DGFRSSHEVQKIEQLTMDDMRALIDDNLVIAHRERALSPENPFIRGTAQNPDVFFQARETVNPFYEACPDIVQKQMDKFAKRVGRSYHLFDYFGHPEAERVIILMGSGAETAQETADYLAEKGEKIGILKVRLYRPFSIKAFISSLPKSVQVLAALDRTKEPGSAGEPLYKDIITALHEAAVEGPFPFAKMPRVIGGRYGLSSKEFTPAMVKGVFDEMTKSSPKNHFTVGIHDDVTNTNIGYDPDFSTEGKDVFRGMFYGLGADGTVGANKNSIKIIGEGTDFSAQGYFVYDSKKAGSMTVSHIRFGKKPVKAPFLVNKAKFVGCHQYSFIDKYEMLDKVEDGGIFLLNTPYGADEIWAKLPIEMQKPIIDKKIKFYAINAADIANKTGMGSRINVIMQTAFFAISDVLPKEQALEAIKNAIKKTYSSKGEEVVKKNYAAVDGTVAAIEEVKVPKTADSKLTRPAMVCSSAPDFVKNVTAKIMALQGDDLPVSAMPIDGTFPTATTQYEKRNIALEVPVWDKEACIQCGFCSLVCPHAAIRIKAYDGAELSKAPSTFKSSDAKGGELKGLKFTVQVAVEDCTGCGACVYSCPAFAKDSDGKKTDKKAINLENQIPLRETERENFEYFLSLKDEGSLKTNRHTVKGSQLVRPLFEFSGACAGCGETPYVKLLTQLFGDHLAITNATGCSSIYGGNLPTTPFAKREDGTGPTWSNSLFEDNAEFGMGIRLAYDKLNEYGLELLSSAKSTVLKNKASLVEDILNADQSSWDKIEEQRARVGELKKELSSSKDNTALAIMSIADYLVKKSTWILGGDGWAYDIG
ncbi:MAG: pyruvate:ferredoxin (flavodoxin) oxidoreductase, partial [Elusimicrobiales bacterium]|nr:pyruvate:ferredoxin (flavodoxin) oxidoreductase [Elusimicrobiales bacterium]